MQINTSELRELIKDKLMEQSQSPVLRNEGRVLALSDNIVQLSGLSAAKQGEVLRIGDRAKALVMTLARDTVSAVLLSDTQEVAEGDRAVCTGDVLSAPVGRGLLGRVVNPLGEPIDGAGPIEAEAYLPIERPAPGVLDRVSVHQPLATGYKAVDAMVPIGRGQRELILGDRQTGKTSLAIDTILNQAQSGVLCFYVAIGQKASTIVKAVEHLRARGAMRYTTIVVASASHSAALQYIAPYAACSMAEYFRDRGEHALIIYDDLSKHAIAYRQLSLLLRRPPGREAYPGDVFYLHSRLLERAACVSREYLESINPPGSIPKGIKSGSLTALPIAETQSGDLSSFVTTNIISITDGQLFLDASLFNSGVRPAVSPGSSVSRIGGAAQHPIIRKSSGQLRTALAQYRELQAFSQFASELEASSKARIEKGKKVTALLKQRQFSPLSAAEQALLFTAVEEGYLDSVELEKVEDFETALLNYAKVQEAEFMQELAEAEQSSKLILEKIGRLLAHFKTVQAF